MNRRDFLKIVGITTATSTAALYGCGSKEGSSEGSKVLGPIPTDKMTYRSFPGLGSDKVSILGYGCMRWYNPQIQISAVSGTKRSIFRQKNKTKRSKKRLHTTLIKPEQKVNEDLCSGFIVL